MTVSLTGRLSRVFDMWNVDLLIFSIFASSLVLGLVFILWYGYASRYAYEEIRFP